MRIRRYAENKVSSDCLRWYKMNVWWFKDPCFFIRGWCVGQHKLVHIVSVCEDWERQRGFKVSVLFCSYRAGHLKIAFNHQKTCRKVPWWNLKNVKEDTRHEHIVEAQCLPVLIMFCWCILVLLLGYDGAWAQNVCQRSVSQWAFYATCSVHRIYVLI
jgi:hypothetical protein